MQCGAGGLGARVVIEADATGFTGTLYPQNANGWVSFGCSVFNGTVAPWNGSAIGTEPRREDCQNINWKFYEEMKT